MTAMPLADLVALPLARAAPALAHLAQPPPGARVEPWFWIGVAAVILAALAFQAVPRRRRPQP